LRGGDVPLLEKKKKKSRKKAKLGKRKACAEALS